MRQERPIRVYHDGRGPFCRWSQRLIEKRDRDRRVEFRDYHISSSETAFTLQELGEAMHVETPDGRWHVGFFGWIEILKALPRLRWLGRLLSIPPLRWLGPFAYRVIASNRYRIPGFVLRWLGAPPLCTTECDLPQVRS